MSNHPSITVPGPTKSVKFPGHPYIGPKQAQSTSRREHLWEHLVLIKMLEFLIDKVVFTGYDDGSDDGWDGIAPGASVKEIFDFCSGVDEISLRGRRLDNDHKFILDFVFGNSPAEILADGRGDCYDTELLDIAEKVQEEMEAAGEAIHLVDMLDWAKDFDTITVTRGDDLNDVRVVQPWLLGQLEDWAEFETPGHDSCFVMIDAVGRRFLIKCLNLAQVEETEE